MRVLLLSYGSRGDVEPMIGLALRLRELGAEPRVCAPPDFAELLAAEGLPLVPLGRSLKEQATEAVTGVPGTQRPPSMAERATRLITTVYEAASAAAEDCAAVVATGLVPAAAAARAVADRLGIPYFFVSYFPNYLPSPHHPPLAWPGHPLPADISDNRALWELNARALNGLFGAPINAHRATLGLPPAEDVRSHVFTTRPWLAADPTLAPWRQPADLDVVQTGAWIRPDHRPLPADLAAFLDSGTPPVYVGFGSMPVRDAAEVARAAIGAVRAQGRRVLLSRGWAGLTPADEGADCFAVGEVNQQALFARVAAVVHHGGAGTTTTAARAGAPQVLVPQMADQPYWADRVADLAIGTAHPGPAPTLASLSAALERALTPETAGRASELAPRITTDGAQRAAKLLVEAVR
ncbi:glycosyltransferase [Streptomyces sp. NPDC014779]|uniref:glycosyltransferase n=1 Tax=unclassified Streptomyces TaxID=2593676 RepID=UPI0036F7F98D